jgi:hypothetical protein
MVLPFSSEQFYEVFRTYNEAVWPAQVFLLGMAAVALGCVLRPRPWSGALIAGVLSLLWAWLALAYHLAFFARINPLAYVFSGVSLAGALTFFWQGVIRRRLRFAWQRGALPYAGLALAVFALAAYPLWSWYAGHAYPYMPTFGLPCPTTLFTVGMLAFGVPSCPRSALVVPVLWCFIGGQAAFLLGVPQDYALFAAGGLGLAMLARRRPAPAQARG